MMKKLFTGVIKKAPYCVAGFLLVTNILHAEVTFASEVSEINPQDEEGNLSVLRCAQKGGLDFWTFLDAVIWHDGTKEAVIEPFNDILYRNQCQANDIIQLINYQDGIRSKIRETFLNCETEKLPNMKKAYNEITAEIYYVRHIVDGELVLSLPFEILQTRSFANAAVVDQNALYREMKERFVKKDFFEEGEFDDFFRHLESKYTDRKYSYIECENGSWQEVAKKWDETVKHFTEDYGGLKGAAAGIAEEADSLGEELSSIKTLDAFSTEESFVAYLGSFVEASVNRMPPKQGFSEVLDGLKEVAPNLPTPGENGDVEGLPKATQQELLNALIFTEKGYDTDLIKTEMMADFAGLYGTSSEGMETFMHQLDGRSSKEIEGLIEVIDDSFSPLNAILAGTKTINDRQCPAN